MDITRRRALYLASLSGLATFATTPTVLAKRYKPNSLKKGWGGTNTDYHELFKVSWYYNWQPASNVRTQAEFVPMIKSGGNVNGGAFGKVGNARKATALLGFNEPEREKQGNLSVEEALELWPKLEKLAKKERLLLSSPAPSSDQGGKKWFEAFMKEAKVRKYRIDFIAYHWYRGYKIQDFKKSLTRIADTHERKIWLTEFHGGYVGGNEKLHANFLTAALKFMEESPIIERYAYFNPKPSVKTSLFTKDGELTKLGKIYQAGGE